MTTEEITIYVGAIVFGLLNGWTAWKLKQSIAQSKESHDRLKNMEVVQQGMKRVMDGPLGIALGKLAKAREEVAVLSLDKGDKRSAEEARATSDEHIEAQANSEWAEEKARKDADRLKGGFP